MCSKVQKADLDSLLHFKANKQTVANALSKKAYKSTVEEIAKEVSQVVVNLDAGLKNITDTVNNKVSDFNLKIKEETQKEIIGIVGRQTATIQQQFKRMSNDLNQKFEQRHEQIDKKLQALVQDKLQGIDKIRQ